MQEATLCWKCKNAVPNFDGAGCPWSKNGEPVEGWNAEPRNLTAHYGRRLVNGKVKSYISKCKSYLVKECPLFDWDGRSVIYTSEDKEKAEKMSIYRHEYYQRNYDYMRAKMNEYKRSLNADEK